MSSGLMPFDEESTEDALLVLEKYTILRKLASGGMASIYLAEQRGSKEICVVKVLHDHLAKNTVLSDRFLREARVGSELRHPNIARLMDAKGENGIFYLAMEFIAGHDLESMMSKLQEKRKMLPPELSVRVALDVLEGLHHAHECVDASGNHLQIVHRDLSPRNVMISYDGDVKIIDFGLARTNLGEFRTAPGTVLGTLRYMSPEQAVADPVDRTSDLYSWSIVLYEMLSGRPLVTGVHVQEILHAVTTRIAPPLSTLNRNIPQALDGVLAKGMSKVREDRFRTAAEMARAIEQAAPHLCRTPKSRIGRFVASIFPDERASADDLAHRTLDPSDFEPTRAGQELTPSVAPPPSRSNGSNGSNGELASESFALANIVVTPNSLDGSTPIVARPRHPSHWLVMPMAAATVLILLTVLIVLALELPKSPPPHVSLPSDPPDPPPHPVVTVVTVEPKAIEPPPPQPMRATTAARVTLPRVRKESPAAPVQGHEPMRHAVGWEAEVHALVDQERLSDAFKRLHERAKELGDAPVSDAVRCAKDGMVLPTPDEISKCVEVLQEAESKR